MEPVCVKHFPFQMYSAFFKMKLLIKLFIATSLGYYHCKHFCIKRVIVSFYNSGQFNL